MALQRWMQAYAWSETSGTAIANTVTETIIFPDVTVRANDINYVGAKLRLTAAGQYSSTVTPTLTFSMRWGGVAGTLICKSPAITVGSSVTAALWYLQALLEVRSSGSSGTIIGDGQVIVFSTTAPTVGSATGAPAVSPMANGGAATPATVTANLTADTALSLTATWGTASASNTLTGLHYLLEWVN